MNQDEHQRERMRAWAGFARVTATFADERLCEFDKRFPAPAAVEPEPRINIEWPACGDAELASLRTKARLWDAVASGKLGIYPRDGDFAVHWDVGHSVMPTAEEAVEAAIAAGALK